MYQIGLNHACRMVVTPWFCTGTQSPNCPHAPTCQCADRKYFHLSSLNPLEKGTWVVEAPGVHWHPTPTCRADLSAAPERNTKARAVQMAQSALIQMKHSSSHQILNITSVSKNSVIISWRTCGQFMESEEQRDNTKSYDLFGIFTLKAVILTSSTHRGKSLVSKRNTFLEWNARDSNVWGMQMHDSQLHPAWVPSNRPSFGNRQLGFIAMVFQGGRSFLVSFCMHNQT